MKLLLMGTGPFAVPSFCALLDSRQHEVVALVTRPAVDRKGRSAPSAYPVRELARDRKLPLLEPQNVNAPDAWALLAGLQPELLVVCDYGQILSPDALGIAPLGGINLHGSLLPKYRGAAPVNWAVLDGETQTGVTVIHMTPRLDAGPVLTVRTTDIAPDETAPELEQRLAKLGVGAVDEAVAMLEQWDGQSPIGTKQDVARATKAPRLKKEDGAVDWSRPAQTIKNQVRGLQPWPGTYTFWPRPPGAPLRLILDRVSVVSQPAEATPGTVVRSGKTDLWVATGEQLLALDRIQPAGKRVLEIGEFLRGYPVQVGDRLGPA